MSRKLLDGKHPTRPPGASKGGAPTDLTRELMEGILAPLRIGAPIVTAIAFNNVNYATMRSWVVRAQEEPESLYGELIRSIYKAIADWELRDTSVLDAHATGRPAVYEMEVVRDSDGTVVRKADGTPLMQPFRDSEGNAILKQSEIKSDWRVALERLSRRKPQYWMKRENNGEMDAILSFDNKKPETKEALSFNERIAQAVDKLEEDV